VRPITIGRSQVEPVASGAVEARVLVVDNYDSFVYNLVQYLGELGAEPLVHRHDELSLAEIEALEPSSSRRVPAGRRTPGSPTR
jgi:Glutamine amidotransferase class-I